MQCQVSCTLLSNITGFLIITLYEETIGHLYGDLFIFMAFRSIIISKATKINLDLNNIVVTYDREPYHINLDEISTIIIDDPRCLVSLRLLSELCIKGINVIFTDASHKPVGSLTTLYNNARAPKKHKEQILWDNNLKGYLWTTIVKEKINNQKLVLEKLKKIDKINILEEYLNSVEYGDASNREGLASRTYFKELFGSTFKRFNEDIINFCLNYTYQVLRSKISQEIISCGYIPTLGICHKSEYNQFNLADDFIEVFRPIIDYYIFLLLDNTKEEFLTPQLKGDLVNILNERVLYKGSSYKIHSVIRVYLQDIFSYLETGDLAKINFPKIIWNT